MSQAATSQRPRGAGGRVAEFFDEHGRMVLALCRTHLRDQQDAEDAAQQTFLNAYRALLGGTRPLDPAAWLATIARNECRSRIARRMSTPAVLPLVDDALPASPAADPEAQADRRAQVDALTAALAELPERQREAVVLRDIYGLSYHEVAAVMSVSTPAVEALLSRARGRLAQSLGPLRAAQGVLLLPASLREELSRLIPGFTAGEAAAVAAGGGVTAVMAKLAAIPVAGKVAATAAVATLAISADGSVVDQDEAPGRRDARPSAGQLIQRPLADVVAPPLRTSTLARDSVRGARPERAPTSAADADDADDSSGPGPGRETADDSSGPGSPNSGSENSGPSDSSGPGSSGSSGSGSSGSGSSDSSGTSGSGSSGDADAGGSSGSTSGSGGSSGSSGSNSGSDGSDMTEPVLETSNSGSSGSGTSGSSGSGSSGYDNSGSGSLSSGTSGSENSGSGSLSSGSSGSGSLSSGSLSSGTSGSGSSGSGSSGSGSGDGDPDD